MQLGLRGELRDERVSGPARLLGEGNTGRQVQVMIAGGARRSRYVGIVMTLNRNN